MEESAVQWLESWYHSHCNGDWEHYSGIKIETLDNPGWVVRIDLDGTEMATKPFPPSDAKPGVDGDDWVFCRVREGTFEGYGGPRQLAAIIHVFRNWCEQYPEWHGTLSPQEEELVVARERIARVRLALNGEIGPEQCQEEGCMHQRVTHSAFCRDHHIANMQRVGALPVLSDDGLRVIQPAND